MRGKRTSGPRPDGRRSIKQGSAWRPPRPSRRRDAVDSKGLPRERDTRRRATATSAPAGCAARRALPRERAAHRVPARSGATGEARARRVPACSGVPHGRWESAKLRPTARRLPGSARASRRRVLPVHGDGQRRARPPPRHPDDPARGGCARRPRRVRDGSGWRRGVPARVPGGVLGPGHHRLGRRSVPAEPRGPPGPRSPTTGSRTCSRTSTRCVTPSRTSTCSTTASASCRGPTPRPCPTPRSARSRSCGWGRGWAPTSATSCRRSYERLVPGGVVIVEDGGEGAAAAAIDAYRSAARRSHAADPSTGLPPSGAAYGPSDAGARRSPIRATRRGR